MEHTQSMSIIIGPQPLKHVQEHVYVKVVIVGDGCVGKTSLRLRYLGEEVRYSYLATVGADFAIKNIEYDGIKISLGIFDLAGQPQYLDVRKLFYYDTRGGLLVYDRTRPESLVNLQMWWKELKKNSQFENLHISVIGNKSDLKPRIDIEDGKRFAKRINAPHYTSSAITGENVEKIFNSMTIEIWKSITQAL
ncbi:MAG: Rab family GTPase [Candidatus Hodarchaeota archaeon]